MENYQEQIVRLTSSGYWTAAPTVDWLELPVASGEGCTAKELVVRIEDNPNTVARTGYIKFTGGSKTCMVTVNQGASSGSTSGDTSGTSEGYLYANAEISTTNAGNGTYTNLSTGTFPTDYYVVGIDKNGDKVITLDVSGATKCIGSQKVNYYLALVFPTSANLQKVEVFDVLQQQWVDFEEAYSITKEASFGSVNGKPYTRWTLCLAACAGATNKYRLTFEKGITK